jgi:hypothetical protein
MQVISLNWTLHDASRFGWVIPAIMQVLMHSTLNNHA